MGDARIDNVLKRLEANVKDGNYYEAQQMIKTLYFR
jgi:flagellar biosynthesis regulator FlbT